MCFQYLFVRLEFKIVNLIDFLLMLNSNDAHKSTIESLKLLN